VDPGFVGAGVIEGGSAAFPSFTEDTVLIILGPDPGQVANGITFALIALLGGTPFEDVVAFLQSTGLFFYVNGGELQGGNCNIHS
jgi:hypothetical protein